MNAKRRLTPTATALVAAALAAHAAGAPPTPPPGQDRKESLAALTKIAAGYRVMPGSGGAAELDEEPAIRWNKPVSNIKDAAMFFWMREGRPVAAGTFLWQGGSGLYHEFQSLVPGPLRAERDGKPVWGTVKPGVTFAPVPGAPAPADARNKRLVQMKTLAEGFRTEAIKSPPFYGENSVYKFRLLPRPLVRYADPVRPEREGAVFAFVQDTDPEVLLILENRAHAGGTRWEFALAPMMGWQAKGWYKDLEVWSVGRQHPAHDPAQPYFVAGPFPVDGEWEAAVSRGRPTGGGPK